MTRPDSPDTRAGRSPLGNALARLGRRGVLLTDETGEPSMRRLLGSLLAHAHEADFALMRIRLAAVDLSAAELARVRRCRVLLGQVDAGTFLEPVASTPHDDRRAQLEALLAFMASGRLEVRAAGAIDWSPDFSVLRGIGQAPGGGGARVAIVGAHYFAKPFPVGGPALSCLTTDPDAALRLRNRFEGLWRNGYDVLAVVSEVVERMLERMPPDATTGAAVVRERLTVPATSVRERLPRSSPIGPLAAAGAGAAIASYTTPLLRADARELALRMLGDRYGDGREEREVNVATALTGFQADAARRAAAILERRGGALVADGVGLGKSFVAMALIEHELRSGGRVVVTTPAVLRKDWMPRLRRLCREVGGELQLDGTAHATTAPASELAGTPAPHAAATWLSHTALSRGAGPDGPVSLVVVDEAHAFRNPATRRYRALASLCRGARVLLLTATPVNNSLRDLHALLQLFAGDADFRDAGTPSLHGAFAAAEQTGDAGALLPVLRAVMVRRSRAFLREQYSGGTLPDGTAVAFPRRAPPEPLRYSLGEAAPDLFPDVAAALAALTLAPFRVAAYGGTGAGRQADAPAELLRYALLKRLESSLVAFRTSVARQARFLGSFLTALESGHLLRPREHRALFATGDGDAVQCVLEALALRPLPRGVDLHRLQADAASDLTALRRILSRLTALAQAADPKLDRLRSLLDDCGDERVVVFTEFRDTARYLARELGRRHAVGLVDGEGALLGGAEAGRREVVERFAPHANAAPDPPARERVRILVATDVLSEGLNLQDARHVASYDLPWNPVRLMQRIGRLDRLGSPHESIRPYHFVPEQGLDEMLGLVRRLRAKLRAIHHVVPGEDAVLAPLECDADAPPPLERLLAGDAAVLDEIERAGTAASDADERLRLLWERRGGGGAAPVAGAAPSEGAPPGAHPATFALDLADRTEHDGRVGHRSDGGWAGGAAGAAVACVDGLPGPDHVLLFFSRGRERRWLTWHGDTQEIVEDDASAAGILVAALDGPPATREPDAACVRRAEAAARAFLRRRDEATATTAAPHGEATDRAARRILRALAGVRGRPPAELCRRADLLLSALRIPPRAGGRLALEESLAALRPDAAAEEVIAAIELVVADWVGPAAACEGGEGDGDGGNRSADRGGAGRTRDTVGEAASWTLSGALEVRGAGAATGRCGDANPPPRCSDRGATSGKSLRQQALTMEADSVSLTGLRHDPA